MKRVLVVDDHDPSRVLLTRILEERGYEVAAEATTGERAVALARALVPDLILMAVGLSGTDGLQAARAIIEWKPLPIVLVSHHCDKDTVERAVSAGVMAHLLKPVRAEALVPVIELAISRFRDCGALRAENGTLKEKLEARKVIERAKGLLMQQRKLSEDEAYSLIKKRSMDLRRPMTEIARAIILAEGLISHDGN